MWILSLQISRLTIQLKAIGVSGLARAQRDWRKELLSIEGTRIGIWGTVGGVGDAWDCSFWFLFRPWFADIYPASENTLAMPMRLSHTPRNRITKKFPIAGTCCCVWANLCDSRPIETRHYSHTVNSCFLSWCFPIWASDILAHSFQRSLALDNLLMHGSSYNQCSKDGLLEIVRKFNLLIRLIALLELHTNLH